METQIFEYRTKLSYTNFISPAVGVVFFYLALTNTAGIAYRGKLILPYPASTYAFVIVGILLIFPLLIVFLKMKKKGVILLGENDLTYTKGTLITKEITLKYVDFKSSTFEEDEDDGSSISIETGKFFDPQFYLKKFKSGSEYEEFCNRIISIIQENTKVD